MSSASIADLPASDSGYEAQSSDVFSKSTSASTMRSIAVKQEDRSATFSISDYLFYPSSPLADQTLGSCRETTPTADTTAGNDSLFTPSRGSSLDDDDPLSSPYPVYSTPPSAKRSAASLSAIFSPSKVPTPTTIVPLHANSSPLFSSPIKAEQPEHSPLRRSAAPSPDSMRTGRPHMSHRQTTPWAMVTIEEDEVLDDFFLPGIHLDVDINEDPGFSSDTCEALTTYLNLPDDDDMLDMLNSIATYPVEAQDPAPAANLASNTDGKPAFSVRGWGDTDELCARSESSPRRFSPYKRPATKGKPFKSSTAYDEADDLALFTSCSLGNALGLFDDYTPVSAAPAPVQNPTMAISSADSWTRYTNSARDDPSWLAYPLREDKLQPSLKRKTARISRNLVTAEKENQEDVVMASMVDGAREKQSTHPNGPDDEANVLAWQGAPVVVGYTFWAGVDPMAYAAPLPYFNGCTAADRTLMHGVNELSVLPGAAREATHRISGVFELEDAGASARLAAVDELLPPWRMVEESFWLD